MYSLLLVCVLFLRLLLCGARSSRESPYGYKTSNLVMLMLYIYIYMYMYREREIHRYMYTYIYIYILHTGVG